MLIKASLIGVHDAMTYKPLLCFKAVPENLKELRMFARAGFGKTVDVISSHTFFYSMSDDECSYDPIKMSDQRTIGEAARYIRENGMLKPGSFIDCEYIRGDKDKPMSFEDEFDRPWTME